VSDRTGHRPLVAFTTLAVAGAGLVAASAYFELVHGLGAARTIAAGAALLAAGLFVSFAHLGQKQRALLATRGVGRSALSNEALVAGLALAGAVVAAGVGLAAGVPSAVATGAAGMLNVALLVSIGLVYRIRGQRTWQGFAVVTPLTAGLAFGAIAVQSAAAEDGVFQVTLLVIAIDALLFSQRWREVVSLPFSEAMLADRWHVRRTQLLAARFFLLDAVPFILLAVSPTPLAVPAAAAGLFLDRFGFYALALQHTTEQEVAGVEARLVVPDHPPAD
jgi:DMSO reductase anchor subunit